jgi:hypothetical protein
VIGGFCFTSYFLVWNETRKGELLHDPVLNLFDAVDVSVYVFIFTYLGIGIGFYHMFKKPSGYILTMISILTIISMRSITMILVPLEAPIGIIPLRDVFLENTFYCGNILKKDLFFSGHTANVFLLAYLVNTRIVKITLLVIGTIVGALVMLQHVHYTIDVIAAPFFAYLAYLLGSYVFKKII